MENRVDLLRKLGTWVGGYGKEGGGEGSRRGRRGELKRATWSRWVKGRDRKQGKIS